MDLELRHLRCLVAIVGSGTFTDAAIEPGVSQAAVSRKPRCFGTSERFSMSQQPVTWRLKRPAKCRLGSLAKIRRHGARSLPPGTAVFRARSRSVRECNDGLQLLDCEPPREHLVRTYVQRGHVRRDRATSRTACRSMRRATAPLPARRTPVAWTRTTSAACREPIRRWWK